ncbi:MAG: T9SS type A sorting domain-containing protein, partial [Candidatus Marinimicrobia bacterium]|nr:T9SS type A sorting domain-containing protein [Candidatus Neomarinimicrobiota bacterium]
SGDVVDTTGTDGQYALMNLNPGSNLITVERNGFETLEEFVTVVAQEDAGTANFELIPKIGAPGELIATPGDETVHLIWNKPGTSLAGDLTGVWTLFFDWNCTGSPGTVEIEFFENGEFYAYGTLQGFWVGEEETVDLSGGAGCDAVNYEYNAYFNFLTTPTIYYMFVDDDEFNGVITSGYGAHDGDNWGQRVDGGQARMPMGNRAVADEMLITNMRDVIFSDRMLNDATMKAQLAEQINLSKSDLYNNLANFRSLSRTSSDSLIGYNVYQVLESGDSLVATTNSADDTTATIAVPANYVEYCYNVRARWNTDDYGVLESNPTDIACAVPYRSGDINFDDVVDVSDLLAVINFILELDLPTENEYRNADVNNDGELNIADVVMIVDVILGRSSSRTLAAVDGDIFVDLLSADQQLLVNLDYAGLTRGIQFELSADQTLEFGTPLLAVNDAGTMVASNRAEDGTVSVVVINTSGGTVERSENVLIRLPYTYNGDRRDRTVVELTDLKAAGMAGESLPVTIREKRIDISIVPSVFALHQNYPNPFNPVTEIQFDVPKESQITLTIYNIMGQEVTTLTNSTLKAGFHSVRWDGTNGLGEQVSTGLYFYRLSSPAFTSIKKMIMVK